MAGGRLIVADRNTDYSHGGCKDISNGDTVKVTQQIPIEIVGLSLAGGTIAGGGTCGVAPFPCDAIDLTTAAALAGSSTLKIANNQFRGAGVSDIDVNMNAGTSDTLALRSVRSGFTEP